MTRRNTKRAGFTLVELVFASTLMLVASLALFGGISYCSRVTHDNSQLLAADAYAFDVAWMRFNENYDSFTPLLLAENITSNAAPVLWNESAPAVCYTIITNTSDLSGFIIDVSVAWGPPGHRRILSKRDGVAAELDFNHPVRLYRSRFSRRLP